MRAQNLGNRLVGVVGVFEIRTNDISQSICKLVVLVIEFVNPSIARVGGQDAFACMGNLRLKAGVRFHIAYLEAGRDTPWGRSDPRG